MPPRFPGPRNQRDVAGRHYLTKAEINALCFAPHKMERPRGWDAPHPIGRYWRSALVVFFNYGVDTGTVWKSTPAHEPILWRHVIWDRQSPDREAKQQSAWGWLFYRRVKTGRHEPWELKDLRKTCATYYDIREIALQVERLCLAMAAEGPASLLRRADCPQDLLGRLAAEVHGPGKRRISFEVKL